MPRKGANTRTWRSCSRRVPIPRDGGSVVAHAWRQINGQIRATKVPLEGTPRRLPTPRGSAAGTALGPRPCHSGETTTTGRVRRKFAAGDVITVGGNDVNGSAYEYTATTPRRTELFETEQPESGGPSAQPWGPSQTALLFVATRAAGAAGRTISSSSPRDARRASSPTPPQPAPAPSGRDRRARTGRSRSERRAMGGGLAGYSSARRSSTRTFQASLRPHLGART